MIATGTNRGADVVVVGGGVVGCACAQALAGQGLSVTLLERETLAAAASGRNQGQLLPSVERTYLPLLREGVACYESLGEETGWPLDLRRVGMLRLAEDDAALRLGARHADALRDSGFDVQFIAADGVADVEVGAARDLVGAFVCPDGWSLNPTVATLALAESARRAGAVVRIGAEVRRLVTHGQRVVGLIVDDGLLPSGNVVAAAGPWTRKLLATAGAVVPVGGCRGSLIQTEPLKWKIRHALEDATLPSPGEIAAAVEPPTLAELAEPQTWLRPPPVAFTLQQDAAGHALVGTDIRPLVGEPVGDVFGRIARRAVRFIPGLAGASVIATWSGIRPTTPDGFPIVGRFPGIENLWIASGHGPEGVTLAPSTGRMIAAEIANGQTSPDQEPFSAARFAD